MCFSSTLNVKIFCLFHSAEWDSYPGVVGSAWSIAKTISPVVVKMSAWAWKFRFANTTTIGRISQPTHRPFLEEKGKKIKSDDKALLVAIQDTWGRRSNEECSFIEAAPSDALIFSRDQADRERERERENENISFPFAQCKSKKKNQSLSRDSRYEKEGTTSLDKTFLLLRKMNISIRERMKTGRGKGTQVLSR